MRTVELIRCVRDKELVSSAAIQDFIAGVTSGHVPDYQTAAFLMAVFQQGLSNESTVALTLAMRDSGVVVEHPDVRAPCIDKHSTGGVGDKISIALAPLVAACGVAVPMVSGRGLGHTGGTLDKLEAIPGFSVDLSISEFQSLVAKYGFALIGQTDELAPADRKLYALRDVTATVESIPLITASILSKKLAEGIEGLVLDVKVGRGAFMKNIEDARELARSLVKVGHDAGLRVQALLTRMEAPLGRFIGNALEIREAIDILKGEGPDDTSTLTMELAMSMLELGDIAPRNEARSLLEAAIASGSALDKFKELVRAQKGDVAAINDPNKLPRAKCIDSVKFISAASDARYIDNIDSYALGVAAMQLGAGRATAEDQIDPGVGIEILKCVGEEVQDGEALVAVHHNDNLGEAMLQKVCTQVREAFTSADKPPVEIPLILERIG